MSVLEKQQKKAIPGNLWTDCIKFNRLFQTSDRNDLETFNDKILAPKVFEGMCFLQEEKENYIYMWKLVSFVFKF